jgi:hypothetical protein
LKEVLDTGNPVFLTSSTYFDKASVITLPPSANTLNEFRPEGSIKVDDIVKDKDPAVANRAGTIPMVGITSFSLMSFARGEGTHSRTTAKAPAS